MSRSEVLSFVTSQLDSDRCTRCTRRVNTNRTDQSIGSQSPLFPSGCAECPSRHVPTASHSTIPRYLKVEVAVSDVAPAPWSFPSPIPLTSPSIYILLKSPKQLLLQHTPNYQNRRLCLFLFCCSLSFPSWVGAEVHAQSIRFGASLGTTNNNINPQFPQFTLHYNTPSHHHMVGSKPLCGESSPALRRCSLQRAFSTRTSDGVITWLSKPVMALCQHGTPSEP